MIKPVGEAKSQWEKLKFHEALSALIWNILVTITGFISKSVLLVNTLCISYAIYAEPMFSAMIFNSLHHDVDMLTNQEVCLLKLNTVHWD